MYSMFRGLLRGRSFDRAPCVGDSRSDHRANTGLYESNVRNLNGSHSFQPTPRMSSFLIFQGWGMLEVFMPQMPTHVTCPLSRLLCWVETR